MKTVATMLKIKEWDFNAADCTMLNNKISYPLRSHHHVGCATHPHDYMPHRYFLQYRNGIVYYVT